VTGPAAQTAAVRLAVRRALEDVAGPVAAAVSGGADSLALAAGLAFERPARTPWWWTTACRPARTGWPPGPPRSAPTSASTPGC
jgi:tRNA(Ile)-lysidine synthase